MLLIDYISVLKSDFYGKKATLSSQYSNLY
ncbi:hypothetical protein Xekj_00034 [Xenorhabdus sp. KJ12.1]|nr:hypothetical protein Xekj_00034 [Xenorhabdus sp. KJ12.1]